MSDIKRHTSLVGDAVSVEIVPNADMGVSSERACYCYQCAVSPVGESTDICWQVMPPR